VVFIGKLQNWKKSKEVLSIKNKKSNPRLISILTPFLITILLILSSFVVFILESFSIEASNLEEIESRSQSQIIIAKDTTWILDNSPYIFSGNVLVQKSATLTIEPGVTIKFDKEKKFRIDGTLHAIGTDSQRIVFTSNNGISNATSPAAGDWGTFTFESPSKNSILKYCTIEYSGGIKNFGVKLKIDHCRINNNFAVDNAGGIFNDGSMVISNSIIAGNSCYESGGGIYNGKNIILENCILTNNSAFFRGGGFFSNGFGEVTLYNSTIAGNNAHDGGGIFLEEGNINIYNCTITENHATSDCGGIYNDYYANTIVKFSIIKENSASSSGGIYNIGDIKISNCTISANTAKNNADGIFINEYNSIIIEYSNLINSSYTIYLNSLEEISLINNWWGTTNTNLIDQSIYDYYDDFDVGRVNYKPFLTKPVDINYIYQPSITNSDLTEDDNTNDINPEKNKNISKFSSSNFEIIVISTASVSLIIIISTFFTGTEIGKYTFFSAIGPLYLKRRKKENINYIKGSVRGYILGNPGERYNDIKKILKLPNGTLTYYLSNLEKEGIIRSERDGFNKRFYPSKGNITNEIIELTEIQQAILKIIEKNPGISQIDIQTQLDISQQRLNYHIKLMSEARLIKVEHVGKITRCFIVDEVS
jgi:DNA-binding MarR family transcriptional regulator